MAHENPHQGDEQEFTSMSGDVGAFSAPTLASAYTDNDGRTVYLVFNATDPPLKPDTANIPGFTVTDNGTPVTVLEAKRKGASGTDARTIVVKLATRLTPLNTVLVSYAAGSPALTDNLSVAVANFSNQAVTNFTSRPVPASAASSYAGNYIDVVFEDYDATALLPASTHIPGFTVSSNGSPITVTTATRLGASGQNALTIRLALASNLGIGHTVTVSYVPASPALTDNTAGQIPSLGFTAFPVTNLTINQVVPVFDGVNSKTSVDGTKVYVTFTVYSVAQNILPATGAIPGFTVKQGATTFTILSAVRADGDTYIDADKRTRTVRLTLASPLSWSGGVTVSYAPTLDEGIFVTDDQLVPNRVANFTDQAVINLTVNRTNPVVNGTPTILNASPNYFDVVFQTFDDVTYDITTLNAALPTTTTSNGAAGFLVRSNGVAIPVTVSKPNGQTYRFTRNSGNFSCEDLVTLTYVQGGVNAVCDSSAVQNRLANFTNLAVSNQINDTVGPTFSWAQVLADGYTIEVYLTKNRTPPILPANPTPVTGFQVMVNGAPRAITAVKKSTSNTTVVISLFDPVGPGDDVKLFYTGGNVTDSTSPTPNAMTFASTYQTVTNNSQEDFAPLFDPYDYALSSSTPVGDADLYERRVGFPAAHLVLDTTPPTGSVLINESPGTGGISVHEFSVFGADETGGGSGVEADFFLNTKFAAMKFTSPGSYFITNIGVQLKVTSPTTGTNQYERVLLYLYADNNGRPGSLLAAATTNFQFSTITTNFTEKKFDLSYNLSADTDYWIVLSYTQPPISSTIEIYSLVDEDGSVANYVEATSSYNVVSGIQGWHKLYGADANATPLAGVSVVEDPLGSSVKQAVNFGGANNESLFETIGTGNQRSLVRYLDDSPKVSSIQIGATSSRPKMYLVEVKTSATAAYQPLFTMISTATTRSYFRYTFNAAVNLYSVRMRYLGDYFAGSNQGVLTITADDPLTGVVAVQLAHFADFRDADAHPDADADGWVALEAGTSTFDWSLQYLEGVYDNVSLGSSTQPLRKIVPYGTQFVGLTASTIYSIVNGTYTVRLSCTPPLAFTCLGVHQGALYVGRSDGILFSTTSGTAYTQVNTEALEPILAVASFRGKLWIGTGRGADGKSRLYSYNGTQFVEEKSFVQPEIRCLTASGSYLYIGVAGEPGFDAGAVYVFDGSTLSLSLSTFTDAVEDICYSTALKKVVAGGAGGTLFQANLNDSGVIQSWTSLYEGDFTRLFSLSDDPVGQYFFACTNTGFLVYIDATDSFAILPEPLVGAFSGLNARWTNSDAQRYKSVGSGDSFVETEDANINYANLSSARPTGVNLNRINASWTGYIKAPTTNTYEITATADDGVRVYINNQLIIDSWVDQSSMVARLGTFSFVQDRWYPVRVEFYNGTSAAPGITLAWKVLGAGGGATIIPASSFSRDTSVLDVAYDGTDAFAVTASGRILALDASSYATKLRTAYVRLKDGVGNITALPGLSDTILQDTYKDASTGVRVSDGRIYQISPEKTVVTTFSSPVAAALYAPDRKTREYATYISAPFYSATLTRWDTISVLAQLVAGTDQAAGLDKGVRVELYVRTANTPEELEVADWGTPFVKSTINTDANPVTPGLATYNFNIATLTGRWIQYKLVMVTASRSITPEVRAVTLTYIAANASYFFTSVFNTATQAPDIVPAPEIRRGLLTSNFTANGGDVRFFYTTDTSAGATFDIARYQPITPNTVFELAEPASTIRIAILLVSVDAGHLAVVDEFAVQLDTGPHDIKWMPSA